MAILQAHRGVSTEYPENTMTAYLAAVEQGYGYIELDPEITKDGTIVLLHDSTLSRTARTDDGKVIENAPRISDITYEEALKYDFGIAFHKKFKGERIPKLKDTLEFAKNNGIKLKLDNKIWRIGAEAILKLCADYPTETAVTCTSADQIKTALSVIPTAEIHYDGAVTKDALDEISALVPRERLVVWLPIKSKGTSWVTVPFVTEELCALVKRYGSLGIWIVSEYEDFDKAVNVYHADIIETNGQIKPERMKGAIADMHSHTTSSHDARSDIFELCETAIKNGVSVLAITDHFDGVTIPKLDPYKVALSSTSSVDKARERFGDKLTILKGIEYGESFWHPAEQKKVEQGFDFDVRLGSVHAVKHYKTEKAFSIEDFSTFTEEEIHSYYVQYLKDMMENLNKIDFDVLTHLDNPKKYLTAKFGFRLPYSEYADLIDDILDYIIAHGIALEINTATLDMLGECMPSLDIVKSWREKGGYLVTIGADSHNVERVGADVDKVIKALKELGLRNIFYYQNKRSYQITV